ncbi:MAG: hypothetical protein ACK5YB_05890 [Burkholderiales bacterium]
MEISRTKLTLVVIASIIVGMAIVIVAGAAYIYAMAFSGSTVTLGGGKDKTPKIASAPYEARPIGFLDSTNLSWGGKSSFDLPELATGDARIAGSAKVDGRPLAGLRLRLRLNSQAKSGWVVTDAQGRYEISVPSGKYMVNGYDLDQEIANRLLSGKILHPGCRFSCSNDSAMSVDPANPGRGLEFDFIDPVEALGPDGDIPLGSELIARWKPYPGAARYRITVYQRKSESGTAGWSWSSTFDWKDRPVVKGESLDLIKAGLKPEADQSYSVSIEALDARGATLSETPSKMMGDDARFRIVKKP